MSEIDAILDIVARKAQIDRRLLVPEAKLDDLNINSLDMVDVVFALEEKFGIELPFNANVVAGEMDTVGDVIALVESQLMEKRRQAAKAE